MIAPPAALLLGVVGVALVAWAWWGLSTADAERPRSTAIAEVALAKPSAVVPGLAPLSTQAARTTPALTKRAVDLPTLLTAPEADLRATLQVALAARAQGGRLYARALARRCADLAGLQVTAPPDLNDARHQRAVARQAALSAGCGQLTNTEWPALVNVAADEAPAGDPLLALQQSDLDDAALLQAVFAQPDPLLLDELGARLLLRRFDGQPTLYFDGQRFDDDTTRATALAALRLLPCHFGLACDERDPEVWLACLRGDSCAASRAEQETPAAQALAARLATALRSRELGRFMPPPS